MLQLERGISMASRLLSKKEKPVRLGSSRSWGSYLRENYDLYLFLLPAIAVVIIFAYVPMYGVQLAFRNFSARAGIMGSPWVGWDNFTRFFNSPFAWQIIRNTLHLSIISLIVGFPIPIILALLLNSVPSVKFRKTVQSVTYAPNFISVVVLSGMVLLFLSPSNGIVNMLLGQLGVEPINFMAQPQMFANIWLWSGIWASMGFSSIIYFAVLSTISDELHEAAIIDGASKFQRVLHIDIPGILPTTTILLILAFGSLVGVGFERVFLLQNDINLSTSEVISTYVYRMGLLRNDIGFATAIGLMNSAINAVLLIAVNWIVRKVSDYSLF